MADDKKNARPEAQNKSTVPGVAGPAGPGGQTPEQLAASHAGLTGVDKVAAYLSMLSPTVPDDHTVFGHAHLRITVGDLKEIVG